MVQNRRRRPTGGRRATFLATALMLGGGGLMAANVYASATEDGSDGNTTRRAGNSAVTIDCPDVGGKLTTVPDGASAEVDRELARLDEQVAAAYQRLQESADAVRQDAGFADNAVMNPLKEKRGATIERIAVAIDRVGDRPEGLESLAACTLRASSDQADGGADGNGDENQNGDQNGDDGRNGDGQQGNGQQDDGQQDDGQQGNGGQAGNGPVAADYADIKSVQPSQQAPDLASGPSRGTFTSSCGVNANGLFNSDNVIVAPGVSNGAHHFHDYIGNQSNNAFASDGDLAKAETSCVDQGDKSTYYWPVLRLQNGAQERDAASPGGGVEGNAGKIVTAKEVTLTFVGNARSKVTAMPRLLRIITGDAKAFVNGTANANASWSCTGFEDRQLKDKYPLCPAGSDVVRTFRFQSCWDGANIDSANHRTHVAFAAADGACPNGFKAVPQLVQRIVYDVDAPSLQDGGKTTPLFAVDSFPEQLHKPVTDHGDFINVFDDGLMGQMVDCINEGRTCGAGAKPGDGGAGNGGDNGSGNNDNAGNGNGGGNGSGNTGNGNGDESGSGNTGDGNASGNNDNGGNGNGGNAGNAGNAGDGGSGDTGSGNGNSGNSGSGSGNGNGGNGSQGSAQQSRSPEAPASAPAEPRVYTKPSPKAAVSAPASAPAAGSGGEIGAPATAPENPAAPTPSSGQSQSQSQSQSPVDSGSGAVGGTEPQAVQGGLAETGANLWPGALGALLVIGGFVVLRRSTRRA